jgi:hypothetical protein
MATDNTPAIQSASLLEMASALNPSNYARLERIVQNIKTRIHNPVRYINVIRHFRAAAEIRSSMGKNNCEPQLSQRGP